jgi:hypothetical protein
MLWGAPYHLHVSLLSTPILLVMLSFHYKTLETTLVVDMNVGWVTDVWLVEGVQMHMIKDASSHQVPLPNMSCLCHHLLNDGWV